MFDKGQERLENDFHIEKIIKELRDIRLFMKIDFFDMQTKFRLQHHRKNVIDLEGKSTEEEDKPNEIDQVEPERKYKKKDVFT